MRAGREVEFVRLLAPRAERSKSRNAIERIGNRFPPKGNNNDRQTNKQ
jgi:hypothetical protein